jgi:drug/metabolite transporter (DMT)-like permease
MIPLLSFTPAFASVLSALVLGEFPGRLQQSGIGLTVVGGLSLHLGGGAVTLRGAWRALRHEPGTPAMLAVAGLWALGAALDKGALGYATAPAHASIQCAAITALLLAALAARGRLAELRAVAAVAGPYAAAVCVACLGLGLQLLALQLALVSVVETVKRALGMALAVASGRLFFGERVTPGKLAGILLLAVGVALTLG